MDSVVPRFAGADESVEQCGALGAAHQAVSAHPGVLLAGGTYRARYPGRSRSRDNSDAERLRGFRDHGCGDSGDSREKIGRGEICWSGCDLFDRSDDGRRESPASRYVTLPRAELFTSVRREVSGPKRPVAVLLDHLVGLSTRVVGAIIMVHGDDQG